MLSYRYRARSHSDLISGRSATYQSRTSTVWHRLTAIRIDEIPFLGKFRYACSPSHGGKGFTPRPPYWCWCNVRVRMKRQHPRRTSTAVVATAETANRLERTSRRATSESRLQPEGLRGWRSGHVRTRLSRRARSKAGHGSMMILPLPDAFLPSSNASWIFDSGKRCVTTWVKSTSRRPMNSNVFGKKNGLSHEP